MNIRKIIEQREREVFSEFASLSINSKGRGYPEEPDEIRTCFQVDRDRIIHSKAFKRLKNKTQVFIMPNNDHFMNRLTHTLETAQVSRTIAVALNLNETLAEAISYCHDLAHVACGHPGEEALNKMFHRGYDHENAVIRRVECLERRGKKRGLNLSAEVLEGASNHSGFDNKPKVGFKEGTITPYADKISYLVSDMENAIKAGIINEVPLSIQSALGNNKSSMMETMIKDIIYSSQDTPYVFMSDRIFEATCEFREFMFKNVYFSSICRKEADKAIRVIGEIYKHLQKNPELIPEDFDDVDIEQNIVDYISSMTDTYCFSLYKKFFFI